MTWFLKIGRDNFVKFLSRNESTPPEAFAARSLEVPPKFGHGELLLVWGQPPGPEVSPCLIIVPDGELQGMIAWLGLLLPQLRPFTAHCRVIAASDARFVLGLRSEPTLPLDRQLPVAAAVVAEAIASSPPGVVVESMSVLSCRSTLSFTAARALAFGYTPDRFFSILGSWERLRELSQLPPHGFLPRSTVHRFVGTVASLASESIEGDVASALCRGMLTSKKVEVSAWKMVTAPFTGMDHLLDVMNGPREERVRALDGAAFANRHMIGHPDFSLVFGCLSSLSNSGERLLRGSPAIAPREYQEVLLWHGFTAALIGTFSSAGALGALIRRVARDLLMPEPLFRTPTCDVSLSELETYIAPNGRLALGFPSTSNRTFEVELAPRISSSVQWANRPTEPPSEQYADAPPANLSRQRPLFVPEEADILPEIYEEHIRRIRAAIDEAAAAVGELSKAQRDRKRGRRRP